MRILTSCFVLVTFPFVAGSLHAQEKPAAKPNIVVILADDMGYADLGCYGSEIKTPHLFDIFIDPIRDVMSGMVR